MSENLFNTPSEEVSRLAIELSETKEALRDLSSKLGRIETRLKRVFPQAFARKTTAGGQRPSEGHEPPTLTPETAMALYEKLVEQARNDQLDQVRQELSVLNLADLSFLRRELGASLGKRKASPRVLIEVITSRVRESVMLSKHTDRRQLLSESSSTDDSPKENQKD
jgi:hypothetical protein